MATILKNVAWGIAWALAFATALSTFVGVQAILRRSFYFDDLGVNLLQVIGMYFTAAFAAGSVAGILRPLARARAGATILGGIVGPFVYGAISFAMGDRGGDLAFIAFVAGVPVGAACGYGFSSPDAATRSILPSEPDAEQSTATADN